MADPDDLPPADDDGAPARPSKKPFLLRLPEDLMADLRAWANQDLRSLNGHLEFLLREALRRRKGGSGQ